MTELETKDGLAAGSVTSAVTATGTAQPAPPIAASADEGSFGRALAAARQARGLSQADVAAQLRLQLRQVRAIEDEDLGALPEGPFVRGFVRNYAKLLELPAEPLLALLSARLKPTEPLRIDGGSAAVSPVQLATREHASRVLVIGGAVAALLLFAALGWWSMRSRPAAEVALSATQVPAPAPVPAAQPIAAAEPPSVPVADGATGQAEATEAAPSPPAPAAVGASALRFNFRERAWVEVRQADGTVLMSRNNDAGTQEVVDGTPPYVLVIGNSSKVDLEFRGEPVDLQAAASSADVARLRLE